MRLRVPFLRREVTTVHPLQLILTIIVTVIVTVLTTLGTFWVQERRLRAELRTEFMAEAAVRQLLLSPRWKKRSFDEIKKRVAGFPDDELRKILVRSAAVRFMDDDGKELWGLIERNEDDLN